MSPHEATRDLSHLEQALKGAAPFIGSRSRTHPDT
jgi:hypothetical protein